jgi:3-phosphoshikimate 1-carboxyvinyltransferase
MNLNEIKKIKIEKLKTPLNKVLDIPSSKSLSVRALLLAAFSNGKSTINNVLDSDDTNNCIKALKILGIGIKQDGRNFEVDGCGGDILIKKDIEVFVGSSGITSRFLLALLVASRFEFSILLDGTPQLRKRPIKPLVDTLIKIGANIEYKEKDGYLPLLIKSTKLDSEYIEVSGKDSSQYVSSVLMMSPLLDKTISIKAVDIDSENHPYIKMALQTMKDFGIDYKEDNNVYTIEPQDYMATNFTIETDFNTANYFFALACATNSRIEINNLDKNTIQPGILFLDVFEKLGCYVEYKDNSIVVNGTNKLSGGFEIDMFSMAEMTMTLAALAVFADKPIKIYNIEHIRKHESDRIHSLYIELEKCGIRCEEFSDGLLINPGRVNNVEVDTYEDHRIVMSLAVMGIAGNGITVKNPSCVSKTCPEFFELLENIGIGLKYEK